MEKMAVKETGEKKKQRKLVTRKNRYQKFCRKKKLNRSKTSLLLQI